MRFLNILMGLRLAAMSPWYHGATALTGLLIDTSVVKSVRVTMPDDSSTYDVSE